MTNVPVWAQEGLTTQPQINSIPYWKNRQPGWAKTVPDGGRQNLDHFKPDKKHHKVLLTQDTWTSVFLKENQKWGFEQKKVSNPT